MTQTPQQIVQANINETFTQLNSALTQCHAAKAQFDAHGATVSAAAAQAAIDALTPLVAKFQDESNLLDQQDHLT